MLNIGAFIDGFRVGPMEGLKIAKEIGCESFQVYITSGGMFSKNMNTQARADFVSRYTDLGIELSATCGDFGLNFGNAALMAEKAADLKAAIEQTADLKTNIMTTHIGALGNDPDGKARETMVRNLKMFGDFAAGLGVTFATETGVESGPHLLSIIEEADTKGLGVNMDPANLVMNGFDHMEAVEVLFPHIVHTHAKDGVREGNQHREVPLGQGGVGFPAYVGKLRTLGYQGAFTIERECGDDPVGDIRKAVEFLKGL